MPTTNPPIRQGDILFIPIDASEIPDGLTTVSRDEHQRLVIAEGETTGHCHAILDDPATMFIRADLDEMEDRFLKVDRDVELVHEEHGTVNLAPGGYIVRRKREYAPEEIRRVVD